jgi:Domain of unknown function (DUF6265)
VEDAGEAFCPRAAGAAATSHVHINDESTIPIVVFMRPSQNSIIVQRPKPVKAIRCARSFRYRTFLGRKLAAIGYLRDRVFTEMARTVAKRFSPTLNPVGKSHRRISRRPRVFRFRIGVLFLFAFGAALVLFASLPADSAQQSAGAGSQSKGGLATTSETAAPATPPQSLPGTNVADFSWLEGRWRGDWGPRVAEQIWTAPKARMMLGDFRLIENDKALVIELFTLVEKTGGINFYFRHFTPELAPWEKSDATLLKLSTAELKKFDFENPANGKPKRIVFTKIDADAYTWRSEIIPDSGDPQIVEITYHRQPFATVAPNPGASKKK